MVADTLLQDGDLSLEGLGDHYPMVVAAGPGRVALLGSSDVAWVVDTRGMRVMGKFPLEADALVAPVSGGYVTRSSERKGWDRLEWWDLPPG